MNEYDLTKVMWAFEKDVRVPVSSWKELGRGLGPYKKVQKVVRPISHNWFPVKSCKEHPHALIIYIYFNKI